jgi:hypothetical protein
MRGGGGENPEEAKAARAAVTLAGNSDAQTAAYRAWRMKYNEAYAAEMKLYIAAQQAERERRDRQLAKSNEESDDEDEGKTIYGSNYRGASPYGR